MKSGEGLRRLRELHAIGQGELAQRAGVSRTSLSNFERGKGQPRHTTVRKLTAALSELSGQTIRPIDLIAAAEREGGVAARKATDP
jgi:predicted transcriptional regulator